MSLTLFGHAKNLRSHKIAVVGKVADISFNFKDIQYGVDNKTEAFKLNCNPCQRVPVLDCTSAPGGGSYIFNSNAIIRHFLRLSENATSATTKMLYGRNIKERSQVDQWLEFSSNELDCHSYPIFYGEREFFKITEAQKKIAVAQLHEACSGLESWLETRTFLVGERVTGADLSVAVSLESVLGMIDEAAEFWKYKNIVRFYHTIFYSAAGFAEGLKLCGRNGFPMEQPKEPCEKKERPTHFVSLRLPQNCAIFSSISALNKEVKESTSPWLKAFVPLSKLHLTLTVMTIHNEEQLLQAKEISSQCFENWQRRTKNRGFLLRSNSLGFFDGGRVAFAHLASDYDHGLLSECVLDLRTQFADAGIDIEGRISDTFVPHVTIAKVTRRIAKNKKLQHAVGKHHTNKLPKTLFTDMKWDDLGAAAFVDAGLCSMQPFIHNSSSSITNITNNSVNKSSENEENPTKTTTLEEENDVEGMKEEEEDENSSSNSDEEIQNDHNNNGNNKQQQGLGKYYDEVVRKNLLV